ncbi:hypothetical protein [Dyadobacter frigoris]|uniref:hypothetical protein n=1 Tax=Dyadobacter frigoris TaxID=2576211 RepID=UPI002555464E|nr:hypothetical protein [Dyadobacter frigoris]
MTSLQQAVAPLLADYYLLIGFIFYRHNLKDKLSNWKSPPITAADAYVKPKKSENEYLQEPGKPSSELTAFSANDQDDDESQAARENETMMWQLEELPIHLKQAAEEAHEKQYTKEEFKQLDPGIAADDRSA